MKGHLPGTAIEAELSDPKQGMMILDGIFSSGGLVLSQVTRLTGIEPHTVQNWIKRGYCSPPKAKKYSERQFCRLVIINMLKDSMRLPEITELPSKINGQLNDESDDMIGDERLYAYFLSIISRLGASGAPSSAVTAAASEALADYEEPFAGGKRRLSRALEVMTCAYYSHRFREKATFLLAAMD